MRNESFDVFRGIGLSIGLGALGWLVIAAAIWGLWHG